MCPGLDPRRRLGHDVLRGGTRILVDLSERRVTLYDRGRQVRWAQGGPIAIHGTNRPDLIGQAVSNGCIRVRNDLLRRLFERTLAGTPVTVRA